MHDLDSTGVCKRCSADSMSGGAQGACLLPAAPEKPKSGPEVLKQDLREILELMDRDPDTATARLLKVSINICARRW